MSKRLLAKLNRLDGRTACALGALVVLSNVAAASDASPAWLAHGTTCMVATDQADASRVGLEVLRSGGNAVDAACAVSFALAVTRPESTGLGGGGFLIARFAEGGAVEALDYRETAPAAARADMFDRALAADRERAPPSVFGYLAVAVPGQVAGLAKASKRWGTKPLAELIAPAIKLAEQGFTIDEHYVEATKTALARYERYPQLKQTCPYVYRVHLNNGKLRKVGDVVKQPALGKLLRRIAEQGADGFYAGPVAEAIEAAMDRGGGVLTKADLAAYSPIQRQPVHGTYRGYDVIAMPPPSSGGVCLIEALNILETMDMPRLFKDDPNLATHYTIEAMKHAFADRARWLSDPRSAAQPVKLLTSKVYARQLAQGLDANTTSEPDTYGCVALPGDAGTSHFCVIDAAGNCVVSTETINTSFGSLAAVDDWGLILNNEMDDFTAHPGQANVYGLMQSARNAPAPGRRPLSSMSPTIVLRDGQPVLLLGGSGGPRIISSVLNVMLKVLDAGMPLEAALSSLRVHHQWRPDEVRFDRTPPETLVASLRARGHKVSSVKAVAAVQAVYRTEGELVGGADPRKGGRPAGY